MKRKEGSPRFRIRERSFEEQAFWDGYPFPGFPFGAKGDLFWGIYDALFFYPPFYSENFPYSPRCPGPYPFGYPPIEENDPPFTIQDPEWNTCKLP